MSTDGKVISFINMKGGVGKTTLSIGIATMFALFGKRVLLIDADPQFNATQAFINPDEYEELQHTIYDLFTESQSLTSPTETVASKDLIKSIQINNDVQIDLIPGSLDLALVGFTPGLGASKNIRNYLRKEKLKETYDFIIVDCPPTMTNYTNAALIASDYYVVPMMTDRYSIKGMRLLNKFINSVIESEDLSLTNLGIIESRVDVSKSKQAALRGKAQSLEEISNIHWFGSYMGVYNILQTGSKGPNPVFYKKSKESIELVAKEMLQQIELQDEGQ